MFVCFMLVCLFVFRRGGGGLGDFGRVWGDKNKYKLEDKFETVK